MQLNTTKDSKTRVWRDVFAALLSAGLLWATFPPVGAAWLVFVALAPIMYVSRNATVKMSVAMWALCGIVFWFFDLSFFPVIRQHSASWGFVVAGWTYGVCFGILYFSLFGLLHACLWRGVVVNRRNSVVWRLMAIAFFEPVLWAGVEWARGTITPGTSWNFLGTAMSQMPGFAYSARIGGVYCVSAIALLINGVLLSLSLMLVDAAHRRNRALEAISGLFVVVLLCCISYPSQFVRKQETSPLRIAMIQRNVPSGRKPLEHEKCDNPRAIYDELLDRVSKDGKIDLVVWPESSLSEFGGDVRDRSAWIEAANVRNKTGGAALLAGGKSITPTERGRRIQNAAALYAIPDGMEDTLDAEGVPPRSLKPQVYVKRNLLPIGEYNPLAKWIPALRDASFFVEAPGEKVGIFDYRDFKIAPLVCYDSVNSELSREAALNGAQMIVLISNDEWYQPSSHPSQHSWQVVARAIETGLPLVSVNNSGPTGVILPNGDSTWLTNGSSNKPLECAKGALAETVQVPKSPMRTFYTLHGDVPLTYVFIFVLVVCILNAVFRTRQNQALEEERS